MQLKKWMILFASLLFVSGCGVTEGDPPISRLGVLSSEPCAAGESMLSLGTVSSPLGQLNLSSSSHRAAQLFTVLCTGIATPGIYLNLQSYGSSQVVYFDLYRGGSIPGTGFFIRSDSFTVGTTPAEYIVFSGDEIELEGGTFYWIVIRGSSSNLRIGHTGDPATSSLVSAYLSMSGLNYEEQNFDLVTRINAQ